MEYFTSGNDRKQRCDPYYQPQPFQQGSCNFDQPLTLFSELENFQTNYYNNKVIAIENYRTELKKNGLELEGVHNLFSNYGNIKKLVQISATIEKNIIYVEYYKCESCEKAINFLNKKFIFDIKLNVIFFIKKK